MRPGKYIIGFSMAVIAGCLGFVLTVVGGAPVALSVTMALMALAVLVLIHLLFSLSRERRAMSEQVNDLTETVAHCMRQVTAVTQRLDELHADVTARVDGETREMRQEVTLVADAVRELADVLEARFGTSPEPAEPAVAHAAPAPQPQPAPAPEQMAPAPQAPAPVMLEPVAPAPVTYAPAIPEPVIHAPVTQAPMAPAPAAPAPVVQTPVAQEPPQPTVAPLAPQAVAEPAPNRVPAAGLPELGRIVPEPLDRSAEIAPTLPETQPIPAEKPALSGSEFGPHALFADAIADGRADIFLQPIVNLPQRRVQFYEAITRIRTLSAGFVDPAVYRRAIADHPAIVDLDLRTLSRALVISKRLSQRGREVRIFMPLSARALADTGFLTEARTLLERNRAIGG
ncbi:MAG: EAL domain-containing protein, partial [Rhodobiaceae bacterium]|nr:EAL domain-containing protein [Rhodobiaceae bacterium]